MRPTARPISVSLRRVTEHETHHVGGRSTHRDAHAELADSLLDGIRENAEHANHRESQRHRGERSDKDSAEPWPRRRLGSDDVDRSHARHRSLLVDARDGSTNRRQQRLGGVHSAGFTLRDAMNHEFCAIGT